MPIETSGFGGSVNTIVSDNPQCAHQQITMLKVVLLLEMKREYFNWLSKPYYFYDFIM